MDFAAIIMMLAMPSSQRLTTGSTCTLAGNVADMLPTCRPDMVMSAIFPRKGMSRRGDTRHAKRGPDTQFLCVFLPTSHRTSPPHHAANEEEEGRRRWTYYNHCHCRGRGVCRL